MRATRRVAAVVVERNLTRVLPCVLRLVLPSIRVRVLPLAVIISQYNGGTRPRVPHVVAREGRALPAAVLAGGPVLDHGGFLVDDGRDAIRTFRLIPERLLGVHLRGLREHDLACMSINEVHVVILFLIDIELMMMLSV